MPGLHEIQPSNPEKNLFRAYVNRNSMNALIQPPFYGGWVYGEVSADVGILVEHTVTTQHGTVVKYDFMDNVDEVTDNDNVRVEHTLRRLLDALGATVSQELFVEYHGQESD